MTRFLGFVLGLVLAFPALGRGYAGIAIGQTDAEQPVVDEYSFFNYTNIDQTSYDGEDNAVKIFGGVAFDGADENAGIEFGYVNFGEMSFTASGQEFPPGGTGRRKLSVSSETEAIFVTFLGKRPIAGQFKLAGKLGPFIWSRQDRITEVTSNTRKSSDSEESVGILYGVELEYDAFSLAYERYSLGFADSDDDVDDDGPLGEIDIDMISFAFKF